MLLGSMNRQMNLPALQRIAMEFERENDIMDQRQDMMDDAIDDATGIEGDEEEGEDIVKEVLDEIGVDLNQSVRIPTSFWKHSVLICLTHSWVKPQQIYKRPLSTNPGLPRLWVLVQAAGAVVVAVVVIRMMMIYKQDWTVCDDELRYLYVFASHHFVSAFPSPLFMIISVHSIANVEFWSCSRMFPSFM